ncbi:MAG: phosphate acyltransferase PlsX [Candidatus Omnitrophica bacterium]|nr:phosphate acyltransferase PlsX [Candidatus Omnitrophota bacterium]
MIRIAIDGMGGDLAPVSVLKGISLFFENNTPDETQIICTITQDGLKRLDAEKKISGLEFVICDNYIQMDQKISLSIFRNKNTTMHKTVEMIKNKQADIAFSAGNTAVFVSIAANELGMIEKIDRPAICVHLPNLKDRYTLLLDVGANVSPKLINLYQYAIMGGFYAENVLGVQKPAIALLNIGEEPGKGDDLRQNAYKKLSEIPEINFIGNIEGYEIFTGKADVIVVDGFCGNIVLKVSEGIGRAFKNIMLREINRSLAGKLGLLLARNSIRRYVRKTDYAEYGGGILLGVNGAVIIGHGRSSPRAVCQALQLGKKIASVSFIEKLKEFSKKWPQE